MTGRCGKLYSLPTLEGTGDKGVLKERRRHTCGGKIDEKESKRLSNMHLWILGANVHELCIVATKLETSNFVLKTRNNKETIHRLFI